jgi:O-phosphoseryl-tRNA(Cys) synthetase
MSLDKLIATFEAEKNQKSQVEFKKDKAVGEKAKPVKVEKAKITQTVKPKKEKELKAETKQIAMQPAPTSVGLMPDFFDSLAYKASANVKKTVHVDPNLYEVLVQIKRKKGLSNVGLLIDAIIDRFINEHKADIKELFTDDL